MQVKIHRPWKELCAAWPRPELKPGYWLRPPQEVEVGVEAVEVVVLLLLLLGALGVPRVEQAQEEGQGEVEQHRGQVEQEE